MNIMDKMYRCSLQDVINYVLNKYPDSDFSRDYQKGYYKHYSEEDYLDRLEKFFRQDLWDCGDPQKDERRFRMLVGAMRRRKDANAWLTELGEMFLWVLNEKYGKDNKITINDEGEIT